MSVQLNLAEALRRSHDWSASEGLPGNPVSPLANIPYATPWDVSKNLPEQLNKDKPYFDALVVLGGGTDSLTVLAMLRSAGTKVLALYIDMGDNGLSWAVTNQCIIYGVPIYIIDGRSIFVKRSNQESYIPGYRMLLYTLATSVADRYHIQVIYDGEYMTPETGPAIPERLLEKELLQGLVSSQGEAELNPTSRAFFVHVYSEAYRREGFFSLVEPLLGLMGKNKIIQFGESLGVPWQFSVTCRKVRSAIRDTSKPNSLPRFH
jgi:7-cyano-7-deazaguanine synthase in queuosine biosynthesis